MTPQLSPSQRSDTNKLPQSIRSRNRALLWVLMGVVAVFYIVSYIRTGDALHSKAPLSRFPVEHDKAAAAQQK